LRPRYFGGQKTRNTPNSESLSATGIGWEMATEVVKDKKRTRHDPTEEFTLRGAVPATQATWSTISLGCHGCQRLHSSWPGVRPIT
jgi:hypothetical protein